MCGIAGFFGPSVPATPPGRLLQDMIGAVRHRGPDGSGVFVDGQVGLAHARLSIIDVAGGAQPMASHDGRLTITFNGEIFNYVEIRDELVARGHVFHSRSDTEVILELYRAMGPDCVTRLNGDFAFALWDSREQRLLIARDRMGVRPLFHTSHRGCLYFASEIKALLAVPGMPAALDPVALDQIFTFWFPLAPRTPFAGIEELLPGHLMVVENGATSIRRYWQLDYPDASDADAYDRRDETEIAAELRSLLDDACRIRLRADVPVGSYLSGGLDSSIVAAMAKNEVADRLRTFSVTFESPEYDETGPQQEMVRALGTDHTSLCATTAAIGAALPDVIRATERPILRTSPVPLFALSGHVRASGYKVVLTGEGADEVFAGYDIFKEAKVRRFNARQPGSAWRHLLLQRLYPYLPRLQSQSPAYLQSFFGGGANDLADPLYSHLPRFRTTAGAKVFFGEALRGRLAGYDALEDFRNQLPERFARWHPLAQAQYLETAHLLPGYILSSQGDRVSMAHAVEGRFPFLDHRVVEFASRIPPRLKLRGLREKHILREAVKDILPPAIGNRVKQPYRAPETVPFVGATAPAYVAEQLAPAAIAAGGVFDPRATERLVAKCRRQGEVGFRDNMAFLGILTTQLWQSAFTSAGAAGLGSAAA
ncbi:MAG: asparagine synthase (glutamine-hydrolyzing) [Bauldia sp.]|nr:asparagine synthase (glutamine-hydrolyzing) [Bauldia sp.]